jgi:hypothetical protein
MSKNVASKAKAPIFLPCYSLLEAPVPAECFHQRRVSTRRLSYQDGIDAQEGSTLKHTTSFQQGTFLSTAAGNFLAKSRDIAGPFRRPSRTPNSNPKAPVDSLRSVDVDRLLECAKRIFYD